ncbi:MAG: carboxypeptidase-like regulatory domain-containing protein [bacterium]|nr:carboxypeptidase-like regulatory domain-containing protein [bacterium]
MRIRNGLWRGVSTLFLLLALATAAFAVTEAEVAYIKGKVEQGLTFSRADLDLAERINAESDSYIDVATAWGQFKGTPQNEQPRTPRRPLDVYVVTEAAMDWFDIVDLGTAVPLGDDAQTQIVLPFQFTFYDVTYGNAWLASNGYLAFGTSPFSSLGNVTIPSATDPNGAIFMFWDDLDPDGGNAGQIYTYHDEANDRFIVQFEAVQHFPSGNPETFQCIIYENGNIRLQYETVSNSASCSIGIENASGTEGEEICFDNAACVTSGSAWEITQPDGVPNPPTNVVANPGQTNVTFTWDDPTTDTNGNPMTPNGIQVWLGPVETGTLLATVGAGTETYTTGDLGAGSFTFNLRAAGGAFFSAAVTVTAVVGNPSYFSDFEADNGQLVPDAGWEWGTPSAVGPASPFSGTHCWGTIIAGNYANLACYNLDLNQELTVGSSEATMEFRMWQNSENFWDGMNIKVSVDGGATWEIVTDVTPVYNEDAMNGNDACMADEVAWSGDQSTLGWRLVTVNLGAYVGQTPIIRFAFGSDGSVTPPGFYIDDLTLWGFGEPEFASVSGTVSLDGGAGAVTSVSVRANGIGNPTTNPAGNGAYSLPQVLVGNRIITGSLVGYHDAVTTIALGTGGATNVNLSLMRLDPPMPTGLVGSVNSTTGLVTLNWDDSVDPLVDVYPVYRRLQGEDTWVQQGTPGTSGYTQTLTVAGIYEYAVSARDNGVSTPVESDATDPITILYGALPPVGTSASGNYDDRIVLNWFAPGTPPEFELSYDAGTNEVQGIAWWGGTPTFGWMAAKFETTGGTATITRVKPFWSDDAAVPFDVDVEVAVFNDVAGVPTFEPLGVTTFTKAGPGTFQDIELAEQVTTEGAAFWVGVRQIGANPLGLGGDNDTPFINNTFKYSFDATAWTAFEPGLLSIPMLRCFAIGDFGALVELSPAPINVTEESLPIREVTIKSEKGVSRSIVGVPNALTTSTSPELLADMTARGARAIASRPANIQPAQRDRDGRHALDDVTHYRIRRDGTQIAEILATLTTYTDLNRVENTQYTYEVRALYDNGQESTNNPTITARCNMRPAAPTGLAANPLGTTQMALAWSAPTTNADGSNLVDLAGFRVYRDGTQIGTTAAGVLTYTDTPPDAQTFYTWTVTAVDEVPNVSDPSDAAIGAVVSPWEVVDFEWTDITANGTVIVNADDINSGLMALPWEFTYYGTAYNQFSVCSNGWLSFTSISNSLGGTMPSATEPNATVAINWMDLNPGAGGDVYMYDDVANDRLIISWVDVPQFGNPANVYSMQIVLAPPTSIYFYYQSVGATLGTVGVENSDGTDAIALWQGGVGAFQPANQTGVGFWAGPSGAVAGLVREFGSNAPVPGAEVWVEELNEFTVTDAQGNFAHSVEPGSYTLRVHKQGYCDQIFEDVVVDDGGTTTRNASLRQPNATFSVSTVNILTQVGQNAQGSFEITNPAASCEVSYEITTNQPWLTVNPASGDVNANQAQMITVNGATSAFAPGDYTATITVNHNDTNNPYLIPVTITVSLDANDNSVIPTEFALKSNYPNPFNASTSLRFDVPSESRVLITIYNVAGQEVARPVDQTMPAGSHSVLYNAENLPTGMYLVKMNAGEFSAVQKMLLLK